MFYVTNAAIRREQKAHIRAVHTNHQFGLPLTGNPGYEWPDSPTIPLYRRRRERDLVLYAAAIGQKRGLLPADMTGWDGIVDNEFLGWERVGREDGTAEVRFTNPERHEPICVSIRFLDWRPETIKELAA